MSDNAQAFNGWMHGWSEMQKQTWDTWSKTAWDMLSKGGTPQQAANPMRFWQESMKPWMSMMGGEPVQQMPWLVQALSGQSDAFMKFSEQFTQAFSNQAGATSGPTQGWAAQVEQAIANLKKMFDPQAFLGDTPSAAAMWGMPMEGFQQFFSALNLNPAGGLGGFNAQAMGTPQQAMRSQIEKFLSMPALGYHREAQEQQQQGVRYWMEYQQAFFDYLVLMSQVGSKSLDELRNLLLDEPEKLNVSTLKALYDLWVKCAEEAYGEVTASEEHALIHAKLINAMMQLKQHQQQVSAGLYKSLNLPDRQELERAHMGVQQLKRKSFELADQLADLQKENQRMQQQLSELSTLRDQMDAMALELAALKAASAGAVAATAAPGAKPKPAAVVKKATTKRSSSQQGES
ncbi:poly(R)-hydroxyalkanoic acid synthase, class III, PhaE subunit [Magnetococcus marinus MC-1]|uniref:Poly(3-hydroxyalkanoate) polymerase subunit PhaE n=1 Tax=Magnetococcus marinus (strain ATCC BAA-1437 / JCM 17883 / MC-1) TaxID=156889 RepID=A0L6T7_MAGMM|nr:class III poly(R)-hydroxyalkanoic acid synthase subunit PhaE [Magnetococcus marinus]ABK43680.1 poly(R)-hydroxyalkanoic acid synthase, class III, PhaE subunit [Magnetococcus marinus MC-1]